MKNTLLLSFLVVIFAFVFQSCKKEENELENLTLYNPFELNNGVELLTIDSTRKFPGYLQVKFHINYQHFADPDSIDRVNVYRDGAYRGTLDAGNDSIFKDNSVLNGVQYHYQLSIRFSNMMETKRTSPFPVIF